MIHCVSMKFSEQPQATSVRRNQLTSFRTNYWLTETLYERPLIMTYIGFFTGALAGDKRVFMVGEDAESQLCYDFIRENTWPQDLRAMHETKQHERTQEATPALAGSNPDPQPVVHRLPG